MTNCSPYELMERVWNKNIVRSISIGFSVLMISCTDQTLTLKKSVIPSSVVRLDGFYYSKSDDDQPGYGITFLYRDGTLFHCGIASEEEFQNIGNFVAGEETVRRKEKESWGLYNLIGNQFIMEGWSSSVGGGLPRYRKEGYIMNDSTIVLTRFIGYEGKIPKVQEIAHSYLYFHAFHPKPDSSNNFLIRYN